MDYDFIKRHRAKFTEKIKSVYPYNDEKVIAAYDAALIETILETSEKRWEAYDKAMDGVFNAMAKEPKGEKA